MSKSNRIRIRLALASGAAILLALSGCAAPAAPAVPEASDASAQTESTTAEPADEQEPAAPRSMVDPAWPWPDSLPRPNGPIISEFTGGNPVGEGGVYEIVFTVASLDEAQAYADELAAVGIEWITPILEEGSVDDAELGIAAMSDSYMATFNVDTATLEATINFMGSLS